MAAAQIQKVALDVVALARTQAKNIVDGIIADFDLSGLQKDSSGANVDEVHSLITNKTLLKYAFVVVVAVIASTIAGRQSARGRNPIYVIFATLAAVFFAPTIFPLVTGNQITWIQNDNTVVTVVGVTIACLLGLRYFVTFLPVRLISGVVIAAASSNIIALGWKTGLTAFKSTSGAFLIAGLDATARPFAPALEAYLVDGALPSLDVLRTHWTATAVYAVISLNTGNEKLAQVAAFVVLAVGILASNLGFTINWLLPIELFLGGRVSSRSSTALADAKRAEIAAANAAAAASPKKKN